jgi:hypothetical protein
VTLQHIVLFSFPRPLTAEEEATAWVLVIATGPANVPDSWIHETPVISPLPFWEKKPATTGSPAPAAPRGWMAVTPVRTDVPRISVV